MSDDVTQDDPSTWHDLGPLADMPAKGGHLVTIGRVQLAVFRMDDADPPVRVVSDVCPHAGASLSAGFVDDGCILCPWHGWAFDAHDGRCPDNPAIGVATYPVRIDAGHVFVRLD